MLKPIFHFVFACLLIVYYNNISAQQCPIIPKPLEAVKTKESFIISSQTKLFIEKPELRSAAGYLQFRMLHMFAIPLIPTPTTPVADVVELRLSNNATANEEGYLLSVTDKKVIITGNSTAGVINGISSLLQLAASGSKKDQKIVLAGWNIKDAPLYAWRGLMLDESRHFFGINKVKSILDWMALYKLNRFHWHLTDEPGWRIEIKKYPRLALVGGVGSHTDPNTPAQYYTQDQIAEVVRYAAERNITVIPEIDMPGHATAANRAYPEFSGGGSEKYPNFTFHPGKEATYSYLTDILREVNALFPSGMLHLGGDEVSFGNQQWLSDPEVKKLMAQNKLNNVLEVEQYFMQRMADSVFKMNAKLLAWDEVANMNFSRDRTIVFWWRHDRLYQLDTALRKGYSAVLCPRIPLYFDFVQDSTHSIGRKWGKAYSSLKGVYDFNARNLSVINDANYRQVLGIQANLWTETIADTHRLDFMLFPRIAALSEAAWTPTDKKDYDAFVRKLKQHFDLYKKEKIHYFDPFNMRL